jgi:cytoskeletal protein CcmA (bactofilin family)
MKKIIFILSTMLLVVSSPFAAEYLTDEVITVNQNDTIKSDLFSGARYLDIHGTIMGDVIAGCEKIAVEGYIEDDILAGGRELVINGKVGDGVIGFAGSILITGEVEGDVIAFGGEVRLTEQARINGNLFVGCGELRLEGAQIEGTIRGGAGKAYLNGLVGKDVKLKLDEVNFGPDYDATYGTELTLHGELDSAKVEYLPADLSLKIHRHKHFFQSVFFFWSLIAALIVGILIISFFRNFSKDYLTWVKSNVLQNMGYGALIVFITPIVFVILMVLVLTIPIGLMLMAVYLILLYLSTIFVSLFVGDYLFKLFTKNGETKNLFLPLLTGIILVFLITHIPFIGWLLGLLIIILGSGSLSTYILELSKAGKNIEG